MTLSLSHFPDCTPLSPCAACEVVASVRDKLSEEDLTVFTDKLATFINALDAERSKSWSGKNPIPLQFSIKVLPLGIRVQNILQRQGIKTIDDLVNTTTDEFGQMREVGSTTIREIETELAKVGRHLK